MGAKPKRRYMRNPQFLTVEEVADMMEMSKNSIRWNLRKEYLRGHNDGYRWRIRLEDVERWREEYYFNLV